MSSNSSGAKSGEVTRVMTPASRMSFSRSPLSSSEEDSEALSSAEADSEAETEVSELPEEPEEAGVEEPEPPPEQEANIETAIRPESIAVRIFFMLDFLSQSRIPLLLHKKEGRRL